MEQLGPGLPTSDVLAEGVIEPEFFDVAKLEKRNGGKGLGDRADAVERLRRRRRLFLAVGVAVPLGPDQTATEDDPNCEPRLGALGQGSRDEGVEQWEGVLEAGWLRGLGGG